MIRAQQHFVSQNANKVVTEIRQMEIDYYTNYFATFGNLSAFMVSLTISGITQVLALDTDVSDWFKIWYWIPTCLSIAFSLHCMITTSYLLVFPPGLALFGELGSMNVVALGMAKEQSHVLWSFALSVLFFGISTGGVFFIVMYQTEAIINCFILLFFMVGWYQYSLRIYNRFKWKDEPETNWENDESAMVDDEAKKGEPGDTVIGDAVHEGYLTLHDKVPQRYYVVLTSNSFLWYFESQKLYVQSPGSPVKTRPITLEEWSPVANALPPYAITLRHTSASTRPLEYRCDTIDELKAWMAVFRSYSFDKDQVHNIMHNADGR